MGLHKKHGSLVKRVDVYEGEDGATEGVWSTRAILVGAQSNY